MRLVANFYSETDIMRASCYDMSDVTARRIVNTCRKYLTQLQSVLEVTHQTIGDSNYALFFEKDEIEFKVTRKNPRSLLGSENDIDEIVDAFTISYLGPFSNVIGIGVLMLKSKPS